MRSFESCYTKGYVLIDWVGGPAGARGHDVRTERSASWPNSEYFPVRLNQRGVEKFVSTWVGDGWAHAWQPQKRLNNKSQFPLYFRFMGKKLTIHRKRDWCSQFLVSMSILWQQRRTTFPKRLMSTRPGFHFSFLKECARGTGRVIHRQKSGKEWRYVTWINRE